MTGCIRGKVKNVVLSLVLEGLVRQSKVHRRTDGRQLIPSELYSLVQVRMRMFVVFSCPHPPSLFRARPKGGSYEQGGGVTNSNHPLNSMDPMGSHGIPWGPMGSHGIHGIPWDPMGSHGSHGIP